MTALSIVSIASSSAARSRWAAGLATSTASEGRTSPIWRRPFMTSVEPVETRSTIASARPEPGRDLDGAGDRDDLDRDAAAPRRTGGRCSGGRWRRAGPARSVDRPVRRVVGDGGRKPAAAIAELANPRQLRAGLADQVVAGDAEVGDAVTDELDDVVGPDEQDVEVVVLDLRHEAAVVLVEDQAGVVEQARVGSTSRPLFGMARRRRRVIDRPRQGRGSTRARRRRRACRASAGSRPRRG